MHAERLDDQGATSLRSQIRTVSARSTEFLLADTAGRPPVLARLEEARAQIQEGFEKMSTLDTENADAMNGLKALNDGYAAMKASVDEVLALAANPRNGS